MNVLGTVFIAALSSIVTVLAFEAAQTRRENKVSSSWMPVGTLLLVSRSTSCPTGWNSRASVLANLDYETSDDFSLQDFDYVVSTENPQIVRLRTCQKAD
ncbi:hypothetical protein PDO_1322 [Rhizobium sp. PDO1-076]|uniref:hypothetical protein n=1 Tax=Rhizobium sp. PDO1-076 TaxID=1125979 RepID=UPI00024E357D|nr:hypothetical protein [Rhizobium sp. PDO1-076]EHS52736.1 hypothetical protein PDO_1322 [Rhizobium sp. PDO1-076]